MASSSSSSPYVLTISPRSWTNHVFLSFRGEDTREKFVGHLYTALENMGIHTFKDDKKLSLGDSINPSLMKAIKESQIAIIVFTENYANSSWCLNELVCIMECKKETGLIVVPIFYDVEPSEVRKQKRKYEEAFARYESEANANIVSWKKALVEACEVSGQHFNNKANMDESELIKDIVKKISKMIRPLSRRVDDNLIGLEARMRDLISKLHIGSDDVRMIGIWGVGGGGKTTLASSVYREISWEFDGCCLAENIREKSSKNGLKNMQEEILSGVLKQGRVQVGSVVEGKDMIMDRLCRKKVLIVLDDVDHLDQLKALAGSHDWFGEGSRIIITTRNQHLLTAHKVNVIHHISLLNNHEAIKLFCKHAPRDYRPVKDYEHLSKEVVSYAGGLPLALTVLGSFLCDIDIDEWRSALARLKDIPNDDIVGKLKISFDGLTKLEKDLFLDIACFFRREKKDKAMEILDACGFHPVIGVKVLTQRALITISKDGKFDMHDLVQEMGHYIVRGEYPNNPEKHSRVWKKEDFLKICATDAPTELDEIEAIRPDIISSHLSQHFPRIVSNTKNLRWIDLIGDLASLFPPRGLCFLRLDGFLQKQLWEGCKIMELRNLDNLIMTPDLDGPPNIERIKISNCRSLEEIHPGIGRLEKLVFLSVEYCINLKKFPPIAGLEKLEVLKFRCGRFRDKNIYHSRLQFSFTDLRNLSLRMCNLEDEDIGSAVWELPNLKTLDLTGNKISRLSFNHMRLPRLKWLDVSFCKELVELSELPSSIAVVMADYCDSLESFGDISNCQWLWKVSFLEKNKLGPLGGGILLDSMLQGNAIEDHFISVSLQHHMIPKGFAGRLFRGRRVTLHFPDDWYHDFCGFSICIVTKLRRPYVHIVIKQEVDEDSLFELRQEPNEALEPGSDETKTCIGYVSFGSLRHTSFSNSSYTMISVELESIYQDSEAESYVGAELVCRKSKGHQHQTKKVATDSSEYWDEELGDRQPPFPIQHDSKSSIKIKWQT